MYLALLLATLAALPQDPAHEPTILERLDALIAKSNAYDHFVAHYRLRDKEDHESALRLVFRAPSDLLIELQSEGQRGCIRIHGRSIVEMHPEKSGRMVKSASEDWFPEAQYTSVLRGLFEQQIPGALRPEELAATEKLFIGLRIDPDGFTFNSGLGTERSARLGWLENMQRAPKQVAAGTGEDFDVSIADDVRMLVSGQSGFLARLEKRTDSGTHVGMELVSLQTEERPRDSEFDLPETKEAPRDDSEAFELSLRLRSFRSSRAELYWTVRRALEDERIKWSEEMPAHVEAILKGMRAVDFAALCGPLAKRWQGFVESAAEQLAAQLDERDLEDPQAREQAAAQVASARSELEKRMDDELESLFSQEYARTPCKSRPALGDDLLAIERRILPEIYAEGCRKPVLAAFDEKLGKQIPEK